MWWIAALVFIGSMYLAYKVFRTFFWNVAIARRRDELEAIAVRADRQHRLYLEGKNQGVYGDYMPALTRPDDIGPRKSFEECRQVLPSETYEVKFDFIKWLEIGEYITAVHWWQVSSIRVVRKESTASTASLFIERGGQGTVTCRIETKGGRNRVESCVILPNDDIKPNPPGE